MNISLIAYSFVEGGAAIAASKYRTLLEKGGNNVSTFSQVEAGRFQFSKRLLSFILTKLQVDGNPIKHSLNLFSYAPIYQYLKKTKEDIHHFHWINNDTFSIFDFDKIPSGSIITLHDEWLYCGSEHCYIVADANLDFINGYHFFKKGVWGIHWNYIIWKIKYQKLRQRSDLIYTVPSQWMLSRAKKSLILKVADIRLLPNPIDTSLFKPILSSETIRFRQKHGIESEDIVFCFGAAGGNVTPLKGAQVLEEAIAILSLKLNKNILKRIKFINFGGAKIDMSELFGFPLISLGYIEKKEQLAELYSSIDCTIVPSLVESFGQVAAEALSCESPVICFQCSGLVDIVKDGETGLTVKPYSSHDLAEKMQQFIFMSEESRNQLGVNGREHVVNQFSYSVIREQYLKIISDAADIKKNNKK